VKLNFGVGIAAFSWFDQKDVYMAVDEHDVVDLQGVKVEWKCGVAIMKPKHDVATVSFQFYIDQCRPVGVEQAGQQYMSLNYYLSTMNCCNRKDQKIREDESFQTIVKKAKRQNKLSKAESSSFKIDALLCAEYCYYILHVSVYDSDDKIRQALTTDVDRSPAAQFKKKLDTFIKKLEEDKVKRYIQPEAFKFVQTELCDEVEKDFRDNLKQLAAMQKKKQLP